MELPSMVQRNGDTLIVRSVVSGNQLYMDQGAGASGPNGEVATVNGIPATHCSPLTRHLQRYVSTSVLEQQLERYRVDTVAGRHIQQQQQQQQQQQRYMQQQQHHHHQHHSQSHNHQHNAHQHHQQQHKQKQQQDQQQQQQNYLQQQQQLSAPAAAATLAKIGGGVDQSLALEAKEEGLPQCKIKRNYSCTYCTYFTQNPRSHLQHLRDEHGEKIVINKCKLCLYASRHYQKLVRHMKMVHGCTDGIASSTGQPRGRRGMGRDVRKRKLEESVGAGGSGAAVASDSAVGQWPGVALGAMGSVPDMTKFEQVKRELELKQEKLKRDIEDFNKKQAEHKQQLATSAAAEAMYAAAAYERQLQAHRERDLKALHGVHYDAPDATDARRSPPTTSSKKNHNNNNHSTIFQLPTAHQAQSSSSSLRSHDLVTPSPTGSATPPSESNNNNKNHNNNNNNSTTSAALAAHQEEPAQNRLLKCSVCDFTTLYRAHLVDHELEAHCKTKFYRCEKCSYVTHIKARFSKHVKYHSMPMIKCVTCDFRTPYKWNLDRHMKNHGGSGQHPCAACDFRADIKQSLTVHEMNHHVPPVGHAAGMSLARRRNKVGATDLSDDYSDSADMMLDDHNNNSDDFDETLLEQGGAAASGGPFAKRARYDDEEPTDLSAKGGSSDTSSVHNQAHTSTNPFAKEPESVLNLSKDLAESRQSLAEIAKIFLNEKQLSDLQQQLDRSDAAQLSPSTTITSSVGSLASRNLRRSQPHGSFFDKLKASAAASGGPSENLICSCGHVAKCLSESIIHRKTCSFTLALAEDDIEEEQYDTDGGRLEIDFVDDDDKHSHSALNLSVTGSTRCQHCRHRCKSSADLLNHLKHCVEAGCGAESYDSQSGESCTGRGGGGGGGAVHDHNHNHNHPMENRVFIWNKMPSSGGGGGGGGGGVGGTDAADGSHCSEEQHSGSSSTGGGGGAGRAMGHGSTEENSYYGVETAPGYGEVTKKMTPEEEAANSSLKKVYKCPHCSFWASTASRFHVHIVGHLNKKPFECSLCSYRSNWRWDITKHIRLKTIRDPSHKNARVLMNDETGRRNYTKYNKYITLMKVTEEDGDPKLMKSGEMTPNQLAFINDVNKAGNVSTSNALAAGVASHLNGLKDDITLEPIMPHGGMQQQLTLGGADNGQLNENILSLASMMSAALASQQREHENATLITPSVTISAVKRTPHGGAATGTPLMSTKPSDDLITDVKQEGNEKKTVYKCRKCGFRHGNRDAVLAHVKIHYQQDPNYPIVTATPTTPLQLAINNSSNYMGVDLKKLIAAMCMPLQGGDNPAAGGAGYAEAAASSTQQHSILSSGLLQQALALSGKSPSKGGVGAAPTAAAATTTTPSAILEHGEQKATRANEASGHGGVVVNKSPTTTSSSSLSPFNGVGGDGGGGGGGGGYGQQGPPSLQHLLSSPPGTYTQHLQMQHNKQQQLHQQQQQHQQQHQQQQQHQHTRQLNANNNRNNLVMGSNTALADGGSSQRQASFASQTPLLESRAAAVAATSPAATVTTLSTSATSVTAGLTGAGASSSISTSTSASSSSSSSHSNNNNNNNNISNNSSSNQHQKSTQLVDGVGGGSQACGGVHGGRAVGAQLHGPNNPNLSSSLTGAGIAKTDSSSHSTQSQLSAEQAGAEAATPASRAVRYDKLHAVRSKLKTPKRSIISPPSSSSSSSSRPATPTTNIGDAAPHSPNIANYFNNQSPSQSQNNRKSNNNHGQSVSPSGLGGRREPPPYRCGICKQVSSWKHVIQRHCRLKHAGNILIENLNRTAWLERREVLYNPLVNSGSGGNECNNNISGQTATKSPPQQQQQLHGNNNNNHSNNNNNNNSMIPNNNNNNNALFMSKNGGAGKEVQDLQAKATAYLAALTATMAGTGGSQQTAALGGGGPTLTLEDLIQLQQNDQIEITRLPAGGGSNGADGGGGGGGGSSSHHNSPPSAGANLIQLLEASGATGTPSALSQSQLNSKSKQQKCPFCPYISESKSQMNYHISLHKPSQYECTQCTFVCAKKQHLSSHMRNAHGNNNQSNASSSSTAAATAMDFGAAMQLAAVLQAQQDANPSLSMPLAMDLTALKNTINAQQQKLLQLQLQQQQQTATAAAVDTQSQSLALTAAPLTYCPKCPARFVLSKHSEAPKAELLEHLKCHSNSNNNDEELKSLDAYKCDYCDYRAPHETLIQTHRYVHTQHYQDKCARLYAGCVEDAEYAAPKLIQMTALSKSTDAIWIVDSELIDELQQEQDQNANITSSAVGGAFATAAGFDHTNSLLKKQLEAGPAPLTAAETVASSTPSPTSSAPASPTAVAAAAKVPQESDDSCTNTQSTSASVATSDLALDAASDCASSAAGSPAPLEKCLHCPYETRNAALYKAHLKHHACVSEQRDAHSCAHCDYSAADERHIVEHTRLHFNAIEKLKTVDFFTSYDKLELSIEADDDNDDEEVDGEQKQQQPEPPRMPAANDADVEEENHDDEKMDADVADEEEVEEPKTDNTIKQEVESHDNDNNNEANAINENTLQEALTAGKALLEGDTEKGRTKNVAMEEAGKPQSPQPPQSNAVDEPTAKKPNTKIILFRTDGCLGVKPANTNEVEAGAEKPKKVAAATTDSDGSSISARLRRHPSRTNGVNDEQSPKAIFVNAKTGQVLSRN